MKGVPWLKENPKRQHQQTTCNEATERKTT